MKGLTSISGLALRGNSVQVHRSERSRHLVLRSAMDDVLPDAFIRALKQERVTSGWLRASGVAADVTLRAFDPQLGAPGAPRKIPGAVQILALESSIGIAGGEPSVSLRALLTRDTESGLQTLAGEIVTARSVAVEAIVVALDDLSLPRALDEKAGVWLIALATGSSAQAAPPAAAAQAAPVPGWSAALSASESDTKPRAALLPALTAPLPARPSRPFYDLDAPSPEAGDVVEHFAFGSCEVIKSDGDRLHLRVGKESRIREIALEMLKVTRLDDMGGKRRFKLERRLG
jgi:hypothetical protein